jgi:hypothetical protein
MRALQMLIHQKKQLLIRLIITLLVKRLKKRVKRAILEVNITLKMSLMRKILLGKNTLLSPDLPDQSLFIELFLVQSKGLLPFLSNIWVVNGPSSSHLVRQL